MELVDKNINYLLTVNCFAEISINPTSLVDVFLNIRPLFGFKFVILGVQPV
jgi:hypothetical protein